MKILLCSTVLFASLLLSAPLAADSRHGYFGGSFGSWQGRSYNRWHNSGWSTGHWQRGWYSPRHYRNNHYRSGYGYGRGRGPARFSYHSHSNEAAVLLGGVVLGSILSSSYREPYPVQTRHTRVVRSYPAARPAAHRVVTRTTSIAPLPQRRLLRDLAGNCFEISRTSSGAELRTQLDPSACSF